MYLAYISQASLEKNRYIKLAHTVREAEKSHNLLSTSWRPRKAGDGDVIQLKSKGLRTGGADCLNLSLRAREDKMRCPNSSK